MNERNPLPGTSPGNTSFTGKVIFFCLKNKLVVVLITLAVVALGLMVAPFDWNLGGLPRNPVAVDAIPDIGENQQIVFTEWQGRSPQDIDDQITYPLTTDLLGIPGVKTVRSYSYFGFSTIFIIFDEKTDFYWSRSRILEKLASLPAGTLPEGVKPALGPDATALGQVFWYTLEGRDPDGKPIGGWDPQELRSIQDWHVRYALMSAGEISEVASIGGFVKEYQIDVDPDAMRAYGVSIQEVFDAVRMSNAEVGARTIEINKVEYIIRGLGFIGDVKDIEQIVLKAVDDVPVRITDIAVVSIGPAMRRGLLDKAGAEAVGGVVVVRYGANPLKAIKNVKGKIAEIASGMPIKPVLDYALVDRASIEAFSDEQGFAAYNGIELNNKAWLAWMRATPREQWPPWLNSSQVTIVPFYDRTGLIYETLGTLNTALFEEILITIIVVIFMVMHLRSSLLISSVLPLAVLMCFIAMKTFGVDANIVSLSGIAIAIGTMVDMGIIICENILKHLDKAAPEEDRLQVVFRAVHEVSGAVLTAVLTTVVSFLPVFTMTGAEGKLFQPLAFTKTFCLIASVIAALTIIPPFAHILFTGRISSRKFKNAGLSLLLLVGIAAGYFVAWWAGVVIIAFAVFHLCHDFLPAIIRKAGFWIANAIALVLVGVLLSNHWSPLGPDQGMIWNFLFVASVMGGLLLFFFLFEKLYAPLLRWFLNHKAVYLVMPLILVLLGLSAWLGFDRTFGFVPTFTEALGVPANKVRLSGPWIKASHLFPGFGKEFMPPLDEGSFLYMPTTMPHASIGEVLDIIQAQDKAIGAIPEVDSVVGKVGRVDSALDPAPISMIETVINYKPEYATDKNGRMVTYRYDLEKQVYPRDDSGALIPDPRGRPYRQWRDHIKSPDDIWREITRAAEIPGTTSAPQLQPIAARLVMLQSGMRAPMGIKIKGPDLETIERVGIELERFLKEIPGVDPDAVIADRIVGSPYLEININREAIARFGLRIRDVQSVIETAIGGIPITTTVEGRERYAVRVRYQRELRDQMETLGRILVAATDGVQVPLEQLADISYVRGPMAIKSEDTFLTGYVLFDKQPGFAEVDVVDTCNRYLQQKLDSGAWALPAGVSYTFSGSYENQLRAQRTLIFVIPVAMFIIFIILYFQFASYLTTLLVWTGLLVAASGGFLMIWFYNQPWFLHFTFFGIDMRELFQVHPINLSVAIWVGFLALFGIATDDGVVIATYLKQSFEQSDIRSITDIREATVKAGLRRIRPCLMTTATTILALLPVLTSTGRGSDVMVPMAIPSFGGMLVELMTLFLIPVLYCLKVEVRFKIRKRLNRLGENKEI